MIVPFTYIRVIYKINLYTNVRVVTPFFQIKIRTLEKKKNGPTQNLL